MKRFLIVAIAMVMCVLCLAACGKKEEEPVESIVPVDEELLGTWMESYWDSGYVFNEDGTGKDIFWSQDFHYKAENGNLLIAYDEGLWAEKEFTYVISGTTLTLTEVLDPATSSASDKPGVWEYTKKE